MSNPSSIEPPKWAKRFLRWFCNPGIREYIEGDLDELFLTEYQTHDLKTAKKRYIKRVLGLLRPFALRREPSYHNRFNFFSMLKNYFKIALRNIHKNWRYSATNIIGLTIGLTCSALVALYVQHELSYDNFHHDPENTYRVAAFRPKGGGWFPTLPIDHAEKLLQKEFPEIKKMARFRRTKTEYVTFRDKKFGEDHALITNPGTEFFDIFKFEFLLGDPKTALEKPNTVVITERTAKRYFGSELPLNQVIQYDTMELMIGGVIENVPTNSHLQFDLLIANKNGVENAASNFCYFLMNDQFDPEHFKQKISNLGLSPTEDDILSEFDVQPVQDIHFQSKYTYELKPPGDIRYLYIFSIIGVIILIISCTNYMNLSIATYAGRNNEIAVRKVMGAGKLSLAGQFLFDALFYSFLSLPLALILMKFCLPVLNNLMEVTLDERLLYSPTYILALLLVALFTGLLAGSYPALVMPRFQAIQLFRKQLFKPNKKINLRRILVTFQFTLLIVLISAGWIMHQQLQFLRNIDLGFEKEGILKIERAWDLGKWENYENLKNKLLMHPHILNVSTGAVPGDEDYGLNFKTADSDIIHGDVISLSVDIDYLETLNIRSAEGNFLFLDKEEKPQLSVFINETFAKRLGYDDPVGKNIISNPGTEWEKERTINGVIKDFHFSSLRHQVDPLIIYAARERKWVGQNVLIKINMKNVSEVKEFTHEAWNTIVPDEPIHMEFMEEDINEFYDQEDRLASTTIYLSIIAIGLAALGLLGLSAYLSSLRIKEIGVRKVLGASAQSILILLNKEFVLLVMIATFLASAVTYFILQHWLENYIYQININPLIFIIVGSISLFFVLLAVSYQSLKAALANPADAIRYE
ncbi:ABC transporter permease [Fulvivirgaceae bacterium BMA10]|uniref:ABC transporter permease n=1 Tax=Splendidivirga corallicola TaxID=3051826 RepID=A0ABT8KSL8_9BACT|nr:ABC transporter permease [Fulvivirgaceae bacterium BMA10]